ncbi:MAG: TonB-dependent receptor [Muribaculaceae bacterium]|nr:TonB-dependent receptor [Muribaculaceae bacterium]
MLERLLFLPLAVCGILSASADSPRAVNGDSLIQIEEVTVTAIKQGHNFTLQPAAATVVGRERLERLNIVAMKDMSEIAPNFYIPDYGSRMTSSIYVRGIGARIDQPVVGLNVDNVPFLNKDCYDFDLPDIQRIEMIRGPQSTLYGRNTMGGLINIYTVSPMQYQGVRIMAEGATHSTYRVSASAYGKIKPNLGMSIAAAFNHTGGYWENSYNHSKVGRENAASLRWRTVWRPASEFSVDNVAALSINRQSGYPYTLDGKKEIAYNDTCFYRRNLFTDGLTLRWRPNDHYNLSSITSFQYLDDNMTLDQDFTTDRYFTLTQKRHEWTLTQDFVAKAKHGCYERITGIFGFIKHTSMDAPVNFYEDGIQRLIVDHRNESNPDYPIAWDTDHFLLGSKFTYPVYGIALYHQSTLDLGPWRAALGLRLDYEHTSLRYHSFTNTGFTVYDATQEGTLTEYHHRNIDIDETGRLSRNFTEFLPKLTVSYDLPMPSPSNLYLSVGRGYKSGGFNTQMFSDVLQQKIMAEMGLAALYTVDEIVSYKPERSWNYELGAHVNCADGRVSTDLALFYIDCRNQQLTMFPEGTTTGRITTNAGRTRSYGAEYQIAFKPVERWTFNTSYGYTNAKFVDFFNGKTSYKGKRVPYAPQSTLFAGITYTEDFQNRIIDKITVNAGCRGVGDIYWNEDNLHRQPFYALLQGSVTAEKGPWSLSLWGENLTGTRYDVFSFISIGNTFFQQGRPRQFGVTLRMNFQNL